jgi:XTP/dITP diphosphohydrolase
MEKLLIASGNSHKILEIKEIFSGCSVEIISTKDLEHPVSEPIESGETFKANAQIKANAYTEVFDGWILADDSGICVDELDGEPGIFSARYSGLDATDEDNREKLKIELGKIGKEKSAAYFVCSICLIHPDREKVDFFESKWHGEILTSEKGAKGFGYDPMFYLPEFGKTAAELDEQTKNKLSHRGQALQLLKANIPNIFK